MSSQTWSGHWHGFGPWTGSGESYREEGRRRPGVGSDPQTNAFLEEKLPPMMTGHWLMRRSQVAETWTRAEDAVAWLQARYAEIPPVEREDGKAAYCSVEWRVAYALDVLPRGKDAVWSYWTRSRMLTSYAVVCCPHLFHPTVPCPLPSTVVSLDSRRTVVSSSLAPA